MTFNIMKFDRMAWRDALRMGLQAAVAASLTYIVMQALGLGEAFVAILSSVLILSRTPDGALGAGVDRIASTLLGSVIGIACLLLLPWGWGTAISLAVTMFVLNGIAALRPAWEYGVVAAVALSLGPEHNAVEVATARGVAIAVGVGMGIAVSLIVWPEFSARRLKRHKARALDALSDRIAQVCAATTADEDPVNKASDHRYHKAMQDAREALRSQRFSKDSRARDELERIDRIHASVVMLDRALEDGWNAGDGPHDLLEAVGDAIESLSRGETPDLASLRDDVDRAPIDDADKGERLRMAAMVFGLKELVSETQKLVELRTA